MHVVVGPGAAVRERHVESGGKARDLRALGKAAAAHHVRLHIIHRLMQQEIAEAEDQALVLAAGERHAGRPPHLGHLQHIVLGDRLLEERYSERLHHLRQAGRVIVVEAAIGVDEQLDVRPDRFAHCANARRILADHLRQRPGLAPPQRLVADHHLQPPVTLRDPELGGGGELLAIEEVEAEGGIQRHARPCAPEEPPHRLPECLALDVPERDVHRRERLRAETGLPARHQCPVELVPDRSWPADRRP